MDIRVERFLTFIKKIQNILSFTFYFLCIIICIRLSNPLIIIAFDINLISLLVIHIFIHIIDKAFEEEQEKNRKKDKTKIKKIAKEIVMFIPVLLLSIVITSFLCAGEPENQSSIIELLKEEPIWISVYVIIIGPMIEECIFRALPYRFIKDKILYIIVSTVVFALLHVVNGSNAFYYIWFYMPISLYYGYRYHKTKDIWVTISMHSFSNLIAILLTLVS